MRELSHDMNWQTQNAVQEQGVSGSITWLPSGIDLTCLPFDSWLLELDRRIESRT